MACDHGMMIMSDHDDAYVNAMLMVNMQANTRSVTVGAQGGRAGTLPPGPIGLPFVPVASGLF